MGYANRPGALDSDRAGEIVLSGTFLHTTDTTEIQSSESANDYLRVVVVLNDRWRVIECQNGIQWIIQRRAGRRGHGTARWDGKNYCRTKEALIRLCRASAGEIGHAALQVFASLPSTIEPGAHAVKWIARRCRVSMARARTIAEHAAIGGRSQ